MQRVKEALLNVPRNLDERRMVLDAAKLVLTTQTRVDANRLKAQELKRTLDPHALLAQAMRDHPALFAHGV